MIINVARPLRGRALEREIHQSRLIVNETGGEGEGGSAIAQAARVRRTDGRTDERTVAAHGRAAFCARACTRGLFWAAQKLLYSDR